MSRENIVGLVPTAVWGYVVFAVKTKGNKDDSVAVYRFPSVEFDAIVAGADPVYLNGEKVSGADIPLEIAEGTLELE